MIRGRVLASLLVAIVLASGCASDEDGSPVEASSAPPDISSFEVVRASSIDGSNAVVVGASLKSFDRAFTVDESASSPESIDIVLPANSVLVQVQVLALSDGYAIAGLLCDQTSGGAAAEVAEVEQCGSGARPVVYFLTRDGDIESNVEMPRVSSPQPNVVFSALADSVVASSLSVSLVHRDGAIEPLDEEGSNLLACGDGSKTILIASIRNGEGDGDEGLQVTVSRSTTDGESLEPLDLRVADYPACVVGGLLLGDRFATGSELIEYAGDTSRGTVLGIDAKGNAVVHVSNLDGVSDTGPQPIGLSRDRKTVIQASDQSTTVSFREVR